MSYSAEVDQSGKIEDTSRDTVLALANGVRFSVLIPSTVKRECVQSLREQGLSGQTLYFQMFATALFFLLKDKLHQVSTIIIDEEYTGKNDQIMEHLTNLLWRQGITIEAERVQFQLIRISGAGLRESHPHDVTITKEAPNYGQGR